MKHRDFLENHVSLTRQISSVRSALSARKTAQTRESACNDVIPLDFYRGNLFLTVEVKSFIRHFFCNKQLCFLFHAMII